MKNFKNNGSFDEMKKDEEEVMAKDKGAYGDDYDDDYDDYYDELDEMEERYNEVMDELAELRKAVMHQHAPSFGAPSNDMAMYSELMRIRDELNKTQASQATNEMQKEIAMLKEKIGGETKTEDSALKEEIIRLNEKIESITNVDATQEDEDEDDGIEICNEAIIDELESIKKEMMSANKNDEIVDAVMTLKQDYFDIMDKLDDISKPVIMSESGEQIIVDNSSIEGDIKAIKEKVFEQAEIFARLLGHNEADEAENNEGFYNDDITLVVEDLATVKETVQAINENSEVTEQLNAIKEELAQMRKEQSEQMSDDNVSIILEEIMSMKDSILMLQDEIQTIKSENQVSVKEDLASIKDMVSKVLSGKVATEQNASTYSDLQEEMQSIKSKLTEISSVSIDEADESVLAEDIAMLNERFDGICDVITNISSTDNDAILEELYALRVELQEIRQATEMAQEIVLNENGEPVLDENGEMVAIDVDINEALSAEISDIRDQLVIITQIMSDNMVDAEPVAAPVIDINLDALMSEISDIKNQLSMTSQAVNVVAQEAVCETEEDESIVMILDDVASIKESVRTINEEPDMGIITEILALREEFQLFKDEVARNAELEIQDADAIMAVKELEKEDRKNEIQSVIAQIKSLQDQVYNISMANVTEDGSEDNVFESYNNIILDEISALRDEVSTLFTGEEIAVITEDIADIKNSIANKSEISTISDMMNVLRDDIAEIKVTDLSAESNAVIMAQVQDLKEDFAAKCAADETTVNFISELVTLVEKLVAVNDEQEEAQEIEEV